MGQNANILDLVFTPRDDDISKIEYQSPLGRSDHSCLLFEYLCPLGMEHKTRTVYLYNKGNYAGMNEELRRAAWDIESATETQESLDRDYEQFCKLLSASCDKFVPKKTFAAGERRKRPGITSAVARAIRKKHRSWTRFMETRTQSKHMEYTRARNKAKAMVKKAAMAHERKIADNAKRNPKEFWSYANLKTKAKEKVPELYTDEQRDRTTTSDTEKAKILNNFFASVFTIEPTGWVPEPEERNFDETLTTIDFSEEEIARKLKKLDQSKSKGPDDIHPRILKETHESVALALQQMFQKSLHSGKIPAAWRKAQVTAIYKKGNKHDPSNYRPVSLTSSVPCKVMEYFVRAEIIKHMDRNDLFTEHQYGFRQHRSTSLQLLLALEEWTKRIEEGRVVDNCYIDVKKAFDTVPHRRLLKKLSSYGIRGAVLKWIEAFLQDREQSVAVNGEKSAPVKVRSGVPQGSVLGPTLFVIYVNDMPEVVQSNLLLYADDSKLFRGIRDDTDTEALQQDLDALQRWSDKWLLEFHPEKCKVIRLGNSRTTKLTYKMKTPAGDTIISWTKAEKDLGVIVDEELKFQEEIEGRTKKGNKIVGVIRRTFTYLDEKMFRTLFTALVRPHLEYASAVWTPYLLRDIRNLEAVQRRATKMVPTLSMLPYPDRLRKLKLPTLNFRRQRGDAIEAYKILTGRYDIEPAKFFEPTEETRTRGHSRKLKKKRATTSVRQSVQHESCGYLEWITRGGRHRAVFGQFQESTRSPLEPTSITLRARITEK